MSEYSKRIIAFSAIAIVVGAGVSLGVVLLPLGSGVESATTLQSTTVTSSSISSMTSQESTVVTSIVMSITTSIASSSSPTTALDTSISSATTIESSMTTTTAISGSSSSCISCGTVSITSVSLTSGKNSSTLEISLAEIGNEYIASASVYLNNTLIGNTPENQTGNIILNIQPNQAQTLVLVIPQSAVPVVANHIYQVLVYAWLGMPGEPANSSASALANVTAS